MAEYIEREAAKGKKVYSTERHEYVIPVAELDWLPAADVRPVVRGEWLETDAYPHRVYCSVCYRTYALNAEWPVWVDGDLPRAFCPNCGAEMKGAER